MVRPSAAPADAGRIARPGPGRRARGATDQEASGDRPATGAGDGRVSVAHRTPSGGRVVVGARTSRPVGKLRAGTRGRPERPWSGRALALEAVAIVRCTRPAAVGRSCRHPAHAAVTRRSRARDPTVPRPPLRPVRRRRPRPGRRPAVRRHRRRGARAACWRATRPTSSASTCPRMRPATSPTTATGARRGRSPPGAPTAILRKDPHPSIYVYEQTYRVPGTTSSGRSAGSSRAAPPRAVRTRDRACCPTSGRCPGRRRTATSCCARPASNTSPVVGLFEDPSRRRSARRLAAVDRGRAGRRRRRRRRRRAIGCGPCPADGDGAPTPVARDRRGRRRPGRSPSPTATIATRRPCATATSGG